MDLHQPPYSGYSTRSLRERGSICTLPQVNKLPIYRELLALVKDRSVALEEYVRQMIQAEEMHAAEVDKMLRKPGELSAFALRAV